MTEGTHAEEPRGIRRFIPPWWTIFFPLVVMIGVGVWRSAGADTDAPAAFVRGLIWPGTAAFGAVALMVWLGWVLDID